MPIRINLLAEAQALEDLRRRDPVKRAIWVGASLLVAMVVASIWLQVKVSFVKAESTRAEALLNARQKEYKQVLDNQAHLQEVTQRLGALQQLATNRLLYGTLLDALQHTPIDDVQLIRFNADQNYVLNEGIKPKTSDGHTTPGRPASVTEKITLTLEARDSGANPGDQVNKFKKSVADCPYFLSMMGTSNEVRLISLSPPSSLEGKAYVQFTLQCRYPEKTR
ncbi:MAG TPA: hypothetical protein VG167_10655 [Verrucomicrobiae bacterium]|nr:hypothetical protein [Verrucomicrobiae bacterium]